MHVSASATLCWKYWKISAPWGAVGRDGARALQVQHNSERERAVTLALEAREREQATSAVCTCLLVHSFSFFYVCVFSVWKTEVPQIQASVLGIVGNMGPKQDRHSRKMQTIYRVEHIPGLDFACEGLIVTRINHFLCH